jgi:hypothetical protein
MGNRGCLQDRGSNVDVAGRTLVAARDHRRTPEHQRHMEGGLVAKEAVGKLPMFPQGLPMVGSEDEESGRLATLKMGLEQRP